MKLYEECRAKYIVSLTITSGDKGKHLGIPFLMSHSDHLNLLKILLHLAKLTIINRKLFISH
jgi:hypothetical protein